MVLESHIAKLVEDLEIPALKKGETGAYLWPLANFRNVEIWENPPFFTLYSRFTPCPKEARETFFTKALHGNLLGMGTEGAVLGLSPDEKFLTLSKEFLSDLSYEDFHAELEAFLNIIDFWQSEAASPAEEM